MTSVPDSEEAGRALIGSVLGARYRIEALLGTGGMGAVYRAEHVHMRKAVAVKVLHREMTLLPEVVARFEREAVAAGRIEHPHVAGATDFGRLDDGSFYMVLEFVEGQSLSALLKAHGALPEERALRIARQMADALAAAHAAGIVHRDLKPENVMLLERDGRPEHVKVLDFGIAKINLGTTGEQQLTQLGTVFGTPEYMAPEQAQGFEVDGRADLYTVGVILYEMLAGTSPFRHDELVVVLTRQITMDPPALPQSISHGTAELVTALLRKDPKERPQTASELRDRLDLLLSGTEKVGAGAPLSGVTPAATVVSAAGKGLDVAHANTALSLPQATRQPLASALALVRRQLSMRPIAVLGYAVPIRLVLLAIGVLLAVFALISTLLFVSGTDSDANQSAVRPELAPTEPDVLALIAKAEAGDRKALAALASRPAEGRTLLEWRALGHGYFRVGELSAGLDIYQAGVLRRSELGADPLVLGDVRFAADHPELNTRALEFAANSLGPSGADLLYDVWEQNRGASAAPTGKQARALLDQEPAKYQRSRALDVLLTLQSTLKRSKCSEIRKLLPEIARDADERSVPMLNRLLERRGCGFLGLSDCYSCLRSTKDLGKAIAEAKIRPKPSFGAVAPPPVPANSQAPAVPLPKSSK